MSLSLTRVPTLAGKSIPTTFAFLPRPTPVAPPPSRERGVLCVDLEYREVMWREV